MVTKNQNSVMIVTDLLHIKIFWYENEISIASKGLNEAWMDSIRLSAKNLSRCGREAFIQYAEEVIGEKLWVHVEQYAREWPE